MSDNTKTSIGLLDLLLVANIILKLTNNITWAWPIVLWPLWVEIIIAGISIIIYIIIWKIFE